MATRRRSPPDSSATMTKGLMDSARHIIGCHAYAVQHPELAACWPDTVIFSIWPRFGQDKSK